MVIVKYITLILIFICSSYMGILISKRYLYRVVELKEMKTALNIFETKVKLTYQPIPQIFEEIAKKTKDNVSKIFQMASEHIKYKDAGTAWQESLNMVETNMNKEDIDTLKGLSNLLGKVNVEGQVSEIKLIDKFLDTQIEKAEQDRRKNEKMYKTLGVTVGLAIVIVLI